MNTIENYIRAVGVCVEYVNDCDKYKTYKTNVADAKQLGGSGTVYYQGKTGPNTFSIVHRDSTTVVHRSDDFVQLGRFKPV